MIDRAIDYADHGYWVIPTVRSTKIPAIPWKDYQTRKPDYKELEQWFTTERNIGVVCGPDSGVVVLDADNEEAIQWIKENTIGWRRTFRVRTRRGIHFYFRYPQGQEVRSKTEVIPGIKVDRKANGGLCTGLGSIHESGFKYCLDDESDLLSIHDLPVYDPAWFPSPIVTVYREKESFQGQTGFDRASRYIDRIHGAGKGQRNSHAFSVAAAVVRDFGLSLEQGMILMTQWNLQNDPALPESELLAIVKSALNSGRYEIGRKLKETR